MVNKAEHFQHYFLLFSLGALLLANTTCTQKKSKTAGIPSPQNLKEPIAPHNFDFEIGSWKTELKRLLNPLTDSTKWVEYEGTTVVQEIWDDRAYLVKLDVEGNAGRIRGLSLRLYKPETKKWSLNYVSSNGIISTPVIGEFKNGRGLFYSHQTLNGREIMVRFIISDITATTVHFEQAFSDDGGETWEINWIATDTRIKNE